jgi:hypothetical protein
MSVFIFFLLLLLKQGHTSESSELTVNREERRGEERRGDVHIDYKPFEVTGPPQGKLETPSCHSPT